MQIPELCWLYKVMNLPCSGADMTHREFVARAILQGTAAVRQRYPLGYKLSGSIAGYNACAERDPYELRDLLLASQTASKDALDRRAEDYWWYRCYEASVEWICNCVSAGAAVGAWGTDDEETAPQH